MLGSLRCFIIMPLTTRSELVARYGGDDDHFLHVLEHLFVPAVQAAGFIAVRPIAEGAELIHAKIVHELRHSDLVLCDLSAENPNVFFEFGIRTAINRPIAIVRDQYSRVPFDVASLNYYSYDAAMGPWRLAKDIERLAQHVRDCYRLSKGRNALWSYFAVASYPDESVDGSTPIAETQRERAPQQAPQPDQTSHVAATTAADNAREPASVPPVAVTATGNLEYDAFVIEVVTPIVKKTHPKFRWRSDDGNVLNLYFDGEEPPLKLRREIYAAAAAARRKVRLHVGGATYMPPELPKHDVV